MNRPVLFVGLVTLAFGACGVIVAVTGPQDEGYTLTRESLRARFALVGTRESRDASLQGRLFGLSDDGGDSAPPDSSTVTTWCGNDGAAPPPPPVSVPGYGPPASTPVTVLNPYPQNVCVQKIVASSFWYFSVPVPSACANWSEFGCTCLSSAAFNPCNVGASGQCVTNGQGYPQYLCVGQ